MRNFLDAIARLFKRKPKLPDPCKKAYVLSCPAGFVYMDSWLIGGADRKLRLVCFPSREMALEACHTSLRNAFGEDIDAVYVAPCEIADADNLLFVNRLVVQSNG